MNPEQKLSVLQYDPGSLLAKLHDDLERLIVIKNIGEYLKQEVLVQFQISFLSDSDYWHLFKFLSIFDAIESFIRINK